MSTNSYFDYLGAYKDMFTLNTRGCGCCSDQVDLEECENKEHIVDLLNKLKADVVTLEEFLKKHE